MLATGEAMRDDLIASLCSSGWARFVWHGIASASQRQPFHRFCVFVFPCDNDSETGPVHISNRSGNDVRGPWFRSDETGNPRSLSRRYILNLPQLYTSYRPVTSEASCPVSVWIAQKVAQI